MGKDQFGSGDKSRRISRKSIKKARKKEGIISKIIRAVKKGKK